MAVWLCQHATVQTRVIHLHQPQALHLVTHFTQSAGALRWCCQEDTISCELLDV